MESYGPFVGFWLLILILGAARGDEPHGADDHPWIWGVCLIVSSAICCAGLILASMASMEIAQAFNPAAAGLGFILAFLPGIAIAAVYTAPLAERLYSLINRSTPNDSAF